MTSPSRTLESGRNPEAVLLGITVEPGTGGLAASLLNEVHRTGAA
jgi:hypothetical protein